MSLESRHALNSWFCTLTYTQKQVPRAPNGNTVVNKKDIQNFIKRLRNFENRKTPKDELAKLKGYNLRYIVFSEYGPATFRPHYHLIIWNLTTYCAKRFHQIWDKGWADIQPPRSSQATEQYAGKYLMKIDDYKGFAVKPFKMSSLQPPIGLRYLQANPDKVQNGLIEMDGWKWPLPRSFRRHFLTDEKWDLLKKISKIQQDLEDDTYYNYLETFMEENKIQGTVESLIKREQQKHIDKQKILTYANNTI